ncbi:MAG: O-antigen ligase family protein, partial [Dehalococcoidia bacterium]
MSTRDVKSQASMGFGGSEASEAPVASSASSALIEACWLVALVAVPLVVNPSGGFAFSIYKASFLRILVGSMAALWVLKTGLSLRPSPEGHASRRAIGFLRAPFTAPILALAVAYLLATALSISPSTSLWGSVARMGGTYTMLSYLVLFLIVAAELRTGAQLNRIVWAIILGSSLVSLLGIAEWLGWSPWLLERVYGTWRAGSTIGHPTTLGAYLVPAIALVVGKIARLRVSGPGPPTGRTAPRLAVLGTLLSLQLAALLFTNARGPWMGLAALAVLFPAILFITNRSWRALRLEVLLLVLGVVFLIGLSQPASLLHGLSDLPFLSRASEMVDLGSGSGRERVVIWEATVDLVMEHPPVVPEKGLPDWARPLLGYGPETLGQTFLSVFPQELRELEPGTRVDRAHNIVLDLLVTVGILGLLAFGWVIALFFLHTARLIKRTRHRGDQVFLAALIAGVTGYLVSQLVGIGAHADQMVFWAILALLAAWGRGFVPAGPQPQDPTSEAADPPLPTRKWGLQGFAALAVALVIVLSGLYINITLMQGDMQTRKGVDLFRQARWAEAASAFQKGLRPPPLHAYNDWHLAQSYSIQALEATGPDEQIRLLGLAADRIEEARALEPAEAGYHQRAGMVYTYWTLRLDPAQYDRAREAYSRAVGVARNDVRIYEQWAILETGTGHYDRALELLERSLEINPLWAPTHYQSGNVYRAVGRAG